MRLYCGQAHGKGVGPTGFFVEFLVAAAVGGLIGLEREHRSDNLTVIAGVRTFPLISLAGFLCAWLAHQGDAAMGPWVMAAGILGAFGFAFMFIHMRAGLGQSGVTTPIAMVVTFLLGALIGYGFTFEAVVVGVATTFLLLTKQRLHRFVHILDDDEILSALQFITILFVLLPFTASLPRGAYGYDWLGRGALLDPFAILLVVIFVSAISFVSLLAMRRIGPGRGMEFSGFLGGLVNSEATTAALAHRARESANLVAPAVVGAILASATMVVRNLAIAGAADPSLRLFFALAPYALPIALLGVFLAFRARTVRAEGIPAVRVRNPFAILPALRFAAIFTGVSILVTLARMYFGEVGVYVGSLGGLVSAGAVIASLASLAASGSVDFEVAVRTCLLAIAASVLVKLFILRAVDEGVYRRARVPFLLLTGAALASVAAAFILA
jgi:uncharacterized membrane protein (DUF4010 family)